ncbi:MAG TPA: hypothetical protein VFD58_25410 [Blastocatellia bacterium]|nr:hypothetical protein [Blastocatellia bacterium]
MRRSVKTPLLLLILFVAALALAQGRDYFKIIVVDEETGRGVPLVELKTTSGVRYYTDSNGIVAFDEPGLLGQEVYFHVSSHGYEYPQDGLGNRGVALKVTGGGSAAIKIKRINIAERLYRVTGEGIYRDSILTGHPVPLKRPLLNGQVTGQDTVIVTPYRGKLYWFWGDTEKLSYPLGNLAVSGATSELPGSGGLDPGVGVDLTYFVNESGFSKAMCPINVLGLKWLEGLMTVKDETGTERLLARYASMKDLEYAYEWGLAIFNDEKEVFERLVRFDLHGPHRSAHPSRALVDGVEYYYLLPDLRVKADLESLKDLNAYEAFTPLRAGSRYDKAASRLDRDPKGRLRYGWKRGTDPIHEHEQRGLIAAGLMKPGESWFSLHDIETGKPVDASADSVFWNDFRKRWVMIGEKWGQVWYAEGDTPLGPWGYGRKVVTHDRYTFYNPTQHPFFDQEGGRVIYFEGTYSNTFSGNPDQTPRYDYNQMMYRLRLDDPRLFLPAPVYRVKGSDGAIRYLLREGVEAGNYWNGIEQAAFFALPPDRKSDGMIPIYAVTNSGGVILQRDSPNASASPLFYALPVATPAETAETIAGAWQCKLKGADGSALPFMLRMKLEGELVTGAADTGVITNGTFRQGRLAINVKNGEDTYTLTAAVRKQKLTGEWKQHNTGTGGTWEGEPADQAQQPSGSPAVVALYEYRNLKGSARLYSTRADLPVKTMKRSADPLCYVWKNPMPMLILDRKAKPLLKQK